MTTALEDAGCWFLRSGIQTPDGGVARYYRSDLARNAAVSTEITGYAASALVYLHSISGRAEFLAAAVAAARYLTRRAWNADSNTFPFEPASPLVYFFDIGIIARGLIAVHRATGDPEFLACAERAALSLAFDFIGDEGFHPVIALPEKQPLACEPRWSRRPGCYQLKSAMAWLDTGGDYANRLFEAALARLLATHESFLSGEPDREKLMDRLHAYCYFLEALLAVADRDEVRAVLAGGICRVAGLLREIAPEFERSDVCAQLLRVRLVAHHLKAVPLDQAAAEQEAQRASSYQSASADPRLRGGFWFGRKREQILPFMNPVSTAFCLQALALWDQHRNQTWRFDLHQLI
ncbi:MAG TPA: hypothetical protein VK419_17790 [Bryobacteraceae bacterium]|nr:hypothetical protein [Bryobacteraceae bacterium]